MSRHCARLGRNGHDRTWVGAPFGRFRARDLATTVEVRTDNPDQLPARPTQRVPAACTSVFVTKYRRTLFTDEMLTFCEHTMRAVSAELDVELVEFNGEADHVHRLVHYLPTLAVSTLVQRLKGRIA